MRKIVVNVLTKAGCTDIHQADDGIPAWEMIEAAHAAGEPFQFILSDWNMPGMTGLDLLIKLRGDERFKKLPFLMVTAEGEKDNVITAIKAGVSNFIIKPFKPDALMEKVNQIFNK